MALSGSTGGSFGGTKLFYALGFLGLDSKALESGLKTAQKSARSQLGKIGKGAKEAAKGFAILGVGITAALGVTVKGALDFNKRFAEVATLGVKELDVLREGVKDLALQYGTNLPENIEALYQVVSATGRDGAEAMMIVEEATKASIAGVASMTDAVALGTGVMNAFALETSDLETIFGEAFVAVKAGVTTFDQLSASVGRVAPLFSAAGLSSAEMFASITALTKAGISTKEAVTGIKAALTNIIAPSGEAVKAAKALGIEFNAMALQEKGLVGFLESVAVATEGDVTKMSELFGSVEALNSVLALTAEDAANVKAAMLGMADATATGKEAFDIMFSADPTRALQRLGAAAQVLQVDIGEILLPSLADVADSMSDIVGAIREWVGLNPKFAEQIIKIAAVVGILGTGLGAVSLALIPVIKLIRGLSIVAIALSGIILTTLNPVIIFLGFALTAIAGAGAIGWVFGRWLDSMFDKVERLRKAIDAFFDALVRIRNQGVLAILRGENEFGLVVGPRTQELIDAGKVDPDAGDGTNESPGFIIGGSRMNNKKQSGTTNVNVAKIEINGTGLNADQLTKVIGDVFLDLRRNKRLSRGGLAALAWPSLSASMT